MALDRARLLRQLSRSSDAVPSELGLFFYGNRHPRPERTRSSLLSEPCCRGGSIAYEASLSDPSLRDAFRESRGCCFFSSYMRDYPRVLVQCPKHPDVGEGVIQGRAFWIIRLVVYVF